MHLNIQELLSVCDCCDTATDACIDKFTVNAGKTPEEIKALLEVGFEYVCEKDGSIFMRKRK